MERESGCFEAATGAKEIESLGAEGDRQGEHKQEPETESDKSPPTVSSAMRCFLGDRVAVVVAGERVIVVEHGNICC